MSLAMSNYREKKELTSTRNSWVRKSTRLRRSSLSSGSFRREVRSQRRGEMYLSPRCLYALRLSLNQGSTTSSVLRKSMAERSTTTSAVCLATFGLGLSMFSLKQMLASSKHQHGLRRLR